MAFHEPSGKTLMFGGNYSNVYSNDTWEWDGGAWTRRFPASNPSPRRDVGLVYDTARQRVLLYGGWYSSGPLADTWEWDGNNWIQLSPASSPGPRYYPGLACDSRRGRCVLHGGSSLAGNSGETWEWDGSNWVLASTQGPVPLRADFGLAYHAASQRVLLFGGYNGNINPSNLGDTWEWDGTSWSQRFPTMAPSPRANCPLVYDPTRERIVEFGGSTNSGVYRDTWEWDGNNWQLRTSTVSTIPSAQYYAMAFDSQRSRVVLFGESSGSSETWEYGPTHPATATSFGSGCPGSAGTPVLGVAAGRLPWLGNTMTMQLTQLPASGLGLVVFGFSNSAWSGGQLPFNLSGHGMSGCNLLVSPDYLVAFVIANGSASVSTQVPNTASLLNMVFFSQGFVGDPTAGPAGITVSNGATLRIGGR